MVKSSKFLDEKRTAPCSKPANFPRISVCHHGKRASRGLIRKLYGNEYGNGAIVDSLHAWNSSNNSGVHTRGHSDIPLSKHPDGINFGIDSRAMFRGDGRKLISRSSTSRTSETPTNFTALSTNYH